MSSFRDIKADIIRHISGEEWTPGSRIPNEIDLARSYGTARATVNRAMAELVDDGIVERRRKAGTFVRDVPLRQVRLSIPIVRSEIEQNGASYRYVLLQSSIGPAPEWLQARLALPSTVEMRKLSCLHLADGLPYQLEDRWINLAATPAARSFAFDKTGPSEWLIRQIPFSEVEISFSAASAGPDEAHSLGCAVGDALFRIERQTYWTGQAVTFVRLWFHRGYRLTSRYGPGTDTQSAARTGRG